MMSLHTKNVQYKGILNSIAEIYRKEGICGFYKGNMANYMVSISSAASLVLFDYFQSEFMVK